MPLGRIGLDGVSAVLWICLVGLIAGFIKLKIATHPTKCVSACEAVDFPLTEEGVKGKKLKNVASSSFLSWWNPAWT